MSYAQVPSNKYKIPKPDGCEFLPYQIAGIEYLAETPRALLADQMGLGKTIQAIGLCNLCATESILIICPASLKSNWEREWNKWTTLNRSMSIISGSTWKDAEVVIINYDIICKHQDKLRSKTWGVIILDECHYIKSLKSTRTKQVVGNRTSGLKPIMGHRVIAITGTPILNRPIEAFPVLRYLDPPSFPNLHSYAVRYCDAKRDGFGWNYTGSSNMMELQKKLRSTLMVRRLKEDVLKDLPPKVRQIVELDADSQASHILKRERDLFGFDKGMLTDEDYARIVKRMKIDMQSEDHIATIRRETAICKINAVARHLADAIDSSGKVVCFFHHKEVGRQLHELFKLESVIITGDTPMALRQGLVDKFQSDPTIKLFLGNIQAAGVGITLTASSHVVFAELSWVPGEVSQAEDRCHRIGQTDSVLVQHLVLEGSIDALMAKVIIRKQQVIDLALDSSIPEWMRDVLM